MHYNTSKIPINVESSRPYGFDEYTYVASLLKLFSHYANELLAIANSHAISRYSFAPISFDIFVRQY